MNIAHFDLILRVVERVATKDQPFDMDGWHKGDAYCAIGHSLLDQEVLQAGLTTKYDSIPYYKGYDSFDALVLFLEIPRDDVSLLFGPSHLTAWQEFHLLNRYVHQGYHAAQEYRERVMIHFFNLFRQYQDGIAPEWFVHRIQRIEGWSRRTFSPWF